MKKILKVKLVVMLGLIFSNFVYSQDPHFSQYYETPLQINPAMTGVN
jgi:hypothetical protein